MSTEGKARPAPADVSLENCDREPIHIPGSIQPHGALLAFDAQGRLLGWSANVGTMLGVSACAGLRSSALALGDEVEVSLQELLRGPAPEDDESLSITLESQVSGGLFDVFLHRQHGVVIIEFEQRQQTHDEVAAFALKAHRAIDRLRRQRSIEALMQMAVEQLREITGFDRVVGYRFRHDDSGDVVAEACDQAMEPYLGRRYPASDIPAQARRLYVLNTLRLVADVGDQPVPIVGMADADPLDMSHCVLRSVSPIHIEYLQNIGVGASMSVSIVIAGKLWGLIACHHRTPHRVAPSIRMACDVLAQVLGSTVQSLLERSRAAMAESAVGLRTRLIESVINEDDLMRSFGALQQELRSAFHAQSLVFTEFGRAIAFGEVTEDERGAIVGALAESGAELVHLHQRDMWPEASRAGIGKWVGLLALRVDPATSAWLVLLRPEQIHTVRWGGRPEKVVKIGPMGPRLTPRGSFNEWREDVRDRAEPWNDPLLSLGRQLAEELRRANARRRAELERARMQMFAMLGHDLRDPLQSITMAAKVLEHGTNRTKLGMRIQASSNRMARLISQVLEMSRLESGLGLQIDRRESDVQQLLADIVDEAQTAYPASQYHLEGGSAGSALIDADRLSQVIANLLSNARHHGDPQAPVRILVDGTADRLHIAVANLGPPILPEVAAQLFMAFKRSSVPNPRNPGGLGLGLYISRQIVVAHGGDITYAYRDGAVVFRIELPRIAPPARGQHPARPLGAERRDPE